MFRSLCLVLFVVLFAVSAPAQSLELNKPIERELSGGQTHVYTLALNAPQIARVVAEQKGADIVLVVSLPNGTKLFDVDSPNGAAGEEVATIAAQQSGTYRLEVRALNANAPPGRYALRLDKFLTETEFVTERLAAVARLWGAVKFFHPYLAYKDMDWDGALIKALPAIKAARTPNEYRQAISGLLQALDDPATMVVMPAAESDAAPAAATSAPKAPTYFRVTDGFVVVQVSDWVAALLNDRNAMGMQQPKMLAEIAQAKGVVLDCRYSGVNAAVAPAFYLGFYLNSLLPMLVQGNIALGTERYRIHNGYAPQVGNTSGGYTSAFVTEAPVALTGQAASKKPLAILLDEKTPSQTALWSGLQTAGAKIVQVGKGNNDGARVHPMVLGDGVRVRVRTTEFVHPNGGATFQADVQLPRDGMSDEQAIAAALTALNAPRSEKAAPTAAVAPAMRTMKDNSYPQMSFPSEEYRLLALFRYWNVINYFFPYKHLTDKPWHTVLTDFIPRFLANKTQLEYEMTVAEMVARLQDTHGFVRGLRTLDAHLGDFTLPLFLRVASGKLTIEGIPNESGAAGLKVGDVIVAIDGESIAQRVAHLAQFKSYSSLQAAHRSVYSTVLRGAKDSLAKLRVMGADGQTREVEVARTTPLGGTISLAAPRKTPIYQVLPNGYGYIDLARLPLVDAHKAMDAMMNTPGLIFDMRGYPNGTAWEIGPRLTEKKNVTAAQFRRPYQAATAFDDEDLADSAPNYMFEQKLGLPKGAIYKGKVVMLINEDAISQSEHTCLFFEAATNVTFIGSPTNGANGDVTNLVLPGGISVSFSGHDVRHADGRQLQRVGIQPHIKVEPTPNGLREGRDEVLEAAVKFLQATAQK